jgi:hypothetical protein
MGLDFGEIYFLFRSQIRHIWQDYKVYIILAVILILVFIWREAKASE